MEWHSNGAGDGDGPCDEANSFTLRTLYEIGANREVDPYEWYDLSDNPDYEPVMDYLHEFMPEGGLYLQKTLKTLISVNGAVCLYDNDDIIKLKSKLYNTSGTLLNGPALSNYTFKWTNNITSAIFTGRNYNFNMNTISAAEYAANKRIIFYLNVTDNATGKLVAFDIKYIYINTANVPAVTFDLSLAGTTMSISDYTLTGSYTNTSWKFGTVYTTEEYLPGPYTFSSPGTYSIKNTIFYGNLASCKVVKSQSITVSEPPLKLSASNSFIAYPNPADNILQLQFENIISDVHVKITNTLGQHVYAEKFNGEQVELKINTEHLAAGNYVLEVIADNYQHSELIEIQH